MAVSLNLLMPDAVFFGSIIYLLKIICQCFNLICGEKVISKKENLD